jgi:hypothetical protein
MMIQETYPCNSDDNSIQAERQGGRQSDMLKAYIGCEASHEDGKQK